MKIITVQGAELKLRISPSFLQNAACPAYMKYHYVDKIDERFIRVAAERGKAAHGAVADLIQHAQNEEIDTSDIPEDLVREAVQKHTPHSIMSELGLVYQWVKLWCERFKMPNNIHGIEDRIALNDEFDECDWDQASYRGILDLNQISGTHCIVTDWKSQPHIVAQSEIDVTIGNAIAEQMTMYCWLAWKMYPHLKTFSVRIWYLRYGFYMETGRNVEQLAEYENVLMIKEKKIAEMDNWNPIPGRHCQYCDFIHLCPIAKDLSPSNPEIITQEQATLAAQRITVMEALTKDLKGKLKVYVNHNDEVRIGENWRFGYAKRESVTWDPVEAAGVLEDHDHELSEVANVDVKKMKKLMKSAAHENVVLEGQLQDIQKPKHSTEFKGYQPGSSEEE